MGDTNNPQESLRLNRLYQSMGDIELLQLRDAFDDLTPVAQDVLRPILQSRTLWEVADPQEAGTTDAETIDRDSLLMDKGVAVRACESLEDAGLLRTFLEERKIECCVMTAKGSFPLRFPEIMVFAGDVDRVAALLDDTDLEALRRSAAESLEGPVTDGSTSCPACGSEEILLQPTREDCLNAWQCANCDNGWRDPLPPEWAEAD